jgi:hypothetical protein
VPPPELLDVDPHELQLLVHLDDVDLALDVVHLVALRLPARRVADRRRRAAQQRDGLEAVQVHPEQRHERHHVPEVQARRRRVDADVRADPLRGQQAVELVL